MAKAADTPNTYDPELVKQLVGKIEDYFTDLDSERGSYMSRCKNIRESIAGVYDEAKARGIPKKELRVFVSARQKLEKARDALADLERDQLETVQMLAEAFGDAADLELFAHALQKAA